MKKTLLASIALLALAAHATPPKETTAPTVAMGQLQAQVLAARQQTAVRTTVTNTATGGAGGSVGPVTAGGATITGLTGISGGTFGGSIGAGAGALTIGTPLVGEGAGSLNVSGGGIGNTTQNIPKQTPPAYAPPASAPAVSCRLIFGFGGSGSSAAISTGLPMGNDGFCVQSKQFGLMDMMNGRAVAQGKPQPFTEADYFRVACKTEGMDELEGCKGVPTLNTTQTSAPVLHETLLAVHHRDLPDERVGVLYAQVASEGRRASMDRPLPSGCPGDLRRHPPLHQGLI